MSIKKLTFLILKKMLKESENNLSIRGGKGYGAGHPLMKKVIVPEKGSSEYYDPFDLEEEYSEEDSEKIKISKLIKGKE
jgi:hypothetical protein